MKMVLAALALMAGTVCAIDRVPAILVSTSTNAYTHGMLTGTNVQTDLNFIDAELSRQSNAVVAVSNRAEAAYALALAGTNGVIVINEGTNVDAQFTYSYQNTGTWTVAACTGGQAWCWASEQSIGKIHVGMYVTGAVFNAGTVVQNVNYETRRIGISLVCAGSGTNVSASFWGAGTYTHDVPTNFTRCRLFVTGGGGSGAGCTTDSGAGGGGAGGTSIGYWSLSTGSTYTVTVGAGGASQTGLGEGNNGGTSSFGSLQTAYGGAGGGTIGGSVTQGGIGGTSTGGQLNLQGCPGDHGVHLEYNGENGGASYWGGAGIGGSDAFTLEQRCGRFGGGGGGHTKGSGITSGKGGDGIVVVEYF
jgi:hypothetical protein